MAFWDAGTTSWVFSTRPITDLADWDAGTTSWVFRTWPITMPAGARQAQEHVETVPAPAGASEAEGDAEPVAASTGTTAPEASAEPLPGPARPAPASDAEGDAAQGRSGDVPAKEGVNEIEAKRLVEQALGKGTAEAMLKGKSAFSDCLASGGDAAECSQTIVSMFFKRFAKPAPAKTHSSLQAYVPPGAEEVNGTLQRVSPSGDCLFGALENDNPEIRDEARRIVADEMLAHPKDLVKIPDIHADGGMLEDTIENFAKTAYPDLDFESYCSIMRLPVREGGLWGEYLEAAVYGKIKNATINVYVHGSAPGMFVRIGRIPAVGSASLEKHLVWTGAHFDRIVNVGEASRTSDDSMEVISTAGSLPAGMTATTAVETQCPLLPIAKSSLPSRKRQREKPPYIPKQDLVAPLGKLTKSPAQWRRDACDDIGLTYKLFRSAKHVRGCPGWLAFTKGVCNVQLVKTSTSSYRRQ